VWFASEDCHETFHGRAPQPSWSVHRPVIAGLFPTESERTRLALVFDQILAVFETFTHAVRCHADQVILSPRRHQQLIAAQAWKVPVLVRTVSVEDPARKVLRRVSELRARANHGPAARTTGPARIDPPGGCRSEPVAPRRLLWRR
jgi:hypothetical protein